MLTSDCAIVVLLDDSHSGVSGKALGDGWPIISSSSSSSIGDL